MDIEIATSGSSTAAATLSIATFRQCEDGVVFIDNAYTPSGTPDPKATITTRIDGQTTATKDGGTSTVLRVKVRAPIAQYNQNGTVVNSLPEVKAHVVVQLPRLLANAVAGAVTTSVQDSLDTQEASQTAKEAIVRALAYLCAMITNEPVNFTKMYQGFTSSPFFMGALGICPLDYQNGDYGTTRVLPPPARS